MGDQLKPWSMSESLTVELHKDKGYLNVGDKDALRTIDDICRLTGGVKRDRGFLKSWNSRTSPTSRYGTLFSTCKQQKQLAEREEWRRSDYLRVKHKGPETEL